MKARILIKNCAFVSDAIAFDLKSFEEGFYVK